MQGGVTLKNVIIVIKLSLIPIWFWPLPCEASKCKLICMKMFDFISLILAVLLIASVMYGIVQNLDNRVLTMKSAMALFPCCHIVWNFLCHKVIYQRLQYITSEMEDFCAQIKPHEEFIIQHRYIDKYANFYGFIIASYYTTLLVLIMGPIVLDQPLPVPADFPFDASQQPLRAITYVHQIVVGLQFSSQLSVNAFMGFLLWLASARFKLLTEDMRVAKNIYDLKKYIKKHQQLLKYASEVAFIVRPFALGTVIFSTISVVIFSLIFITGVSFAWKIQFFFMLFSALSQMFIYSWPAEHLIYISNEVGRTAFETSWYDKSNDIRKKLLIIMLRSQKPVTVALPCGLPTLSFHYCASYLSAIFTYFTTMRIMFEN